MPQVVAIILWVLLGLISLPIAYILFGCVCALFVNRKKQYTKHNGFYRFLLNSITIMVLFVLRVKIHVTGREHLPEGRFLLASNHRSNYDPIVTWAVLRKQNLAFVSKPSNFKIPFFGWIARRCCFMAIDRENARNAITTLNTASQLIIDNQTSVAVYPEGTRSKTGELLPFHNMMFRIAQKSKVPIVVMTVCGTEKIRKRTPWRRTHVYINILGTIPAEEVLSKHTSELGEQIYQQMTDSLK